MAGVEIQTFIHQLSPRTEFRIARKRSSPYRNVLLRVERDGIVGWGEASPNPFYNETAEDVVEAIESIAGWLRDLPLTSVASIEAAWKVGWENHALTRAAQCAVD